MSINNRIKEVRTSNKLTQKEFSDSLGIKQSTLSQIEREIIQPSLNIIQKIIGNYNISYNWLIDGSEFGNPKSEYSKVVLGNVVSDYNNIRDLHHSLIWVCGVLKYNGNRKFTKYEVDTLNLITENLSIPFNAASEKRSMTKEEEITISQCVTYATVQLYKYINELENHLPCFIEKFDDLIEEED